MEKNHPTEKSEEPTTEKSNEPAIEESNEPATEKSEEPAIEESNEPATEKSEEPATEESEEPATEESEEPATEESEEPATEESEEPATEESEEPATEESEEPATEESEEPAIEESNEPAIEESNEPAIEESKDIKKHPAVICCYAAAQGNIGLVKSILDEKPKGLCIDHVMGSAISNNQLEIVDLCFGRGATDLEFNMRHVESVETMKYLIKMHGGEIKYVESSLYYSIGQRRMQLSRDILQYARENGVLLNWNEIVGGCIFLKYEQGLEFCLKEGSDSLDTSNRTKIHDILNELNRTRISNVVFV